MGKLILMFFLATSVLAGIIFTIIIAIFSYRKREYISFDRAVRAVVFSLILISIPLMIMMLLLET